MTTVNIYSIIKIDSESITPKFLQVSNAILKGIENEQLSKGYLLPSINDLSYELEISRDAAERAYRYLKQQGIVGSIPGKGYFIANTVFRQPTRIFLLFNKLSAHKKIIYDSFVATLGEHAVVDFYIYNNNFLQFKKFIAGSQDNYSYYIIIPHFTDGGEHAHEIINTIPKEKLLLMSKLLPAVTGNYAAVYEDFEKDIFGALEQLNDKLSKYETLKIIFPEDPVNGAARELEEETGLRALKYTRIVEMHLSNSVSDEYAVVYLAQGLTQHTAAPEETEQLVVKKMPFEVAYQMVEDGLITDSMSVAAILKVKLMLVANVII